MVPGWRKEWNIGVRVTSSKKLVAFVSAIPVTLRVRLDTFVASEVNFICVHQKLRNKRLAPTLIREITRRTNLCEIWQGVYTAGIVLPRPISTCRYFHRVLDWQKLYEVGFCYLPKNSRPQDQIRKYTIPDTTSTRGLREAQREDTNTLLHLYNQYSARFDLTPQFTKEEFEHWFLPKKDEEQIIWTYVVEVRLLIKYEISYLIYKIGQS